MPTQSKQTLITQATEKNLQNEEKQIKKCFSVGAEAKIFRQENLVIKDRVSKGYRHPELDKKIIKQRTKKEAKILEKAHKLISSPKPTKTTNNEIIMPFIEGKKLSEELENLNYKEICKQIGNKIAKLHDNNIIHVDLTTSNMIFVDKSREAQKNNLKKSKRELIVNDTKNINDCGKNEQDEVLKQNISEASVSEPYKDSEVVFIDFGLGFTSSRIEDRAVDLHLIKQALEAKHYSIWKEAWRLIEENYNSKDHKKTLEQLKKVESRGRYKHGS